MSNRSGDSSVSNSDGVPQVDLSHEGGNGYVPENELMRAIILRAIEDYKQQTEHYQDAIDFFNSEEDEYVFSFVAICRHLGFSPEKTRDSILNATHKISTRRRAA